jgi:hypothetical protein
MLISMWLESCEHRPICIFNSRMMPLVIPESNDDFATQMFCSSCWEYAAMKFSSSLFLFDFKIEFYLSV